MLAFNDFFLYHSIQISIFSTNVGASRFKLKKSFLSKITFGSNVDGFFFPEYLVQIIQNVYILILFALILRYKRNYQR